MTLSGQGDRAAWMNVKKQRVLLRKMTYSTLKSEFILYICLYYGKEMLCVWFNIPLPLRMAQKRWILLVLVNFSQLCILFNTFFMPLELQLWWTVQLLFNTLTFHANFYDSRLYIGFELLSVALVSTIWIYQCFISLSGRLKKLSQLVTVSNWSSLLCCIKHYSGIKSRTQSWNYGFQFWKKLSADNQVKFAIWLFF